MNERKKKREPLDMPGSRFPFAGILVAIALVAAFFYGVVGEDKFLLLSPLAIVGYVCLAVWMAMAAFMKRSASVAPPAFYPFLVFLAYGAAMGSVSAIPYEAKVRMLLIGLFVGAYYLWGNSLILFRRSKTVLGWVLLLVLLGCFYGLVNHFKNPDQVLWTTRYYTYEGRLASTYICPNHFAHLLQMLLPFCLVLIFIPQSGTFLRILSGYCIVIYIPTLYFTESRAGMLGSIVAVGITTCLLALRKSKKLFFLLLVVVPLFSTILLVGAWNCSEMFKRRMTPMVEFLADAKTEGFADTKTTDFRPLTWLDTIDMVKAKPATGFGPGSYRYAFPEFRKRCKVVRLVSGHPHNEYLEVASEYGLIGFGLFALAWCYGLFRLLVFSLKTPNLHHAFMAMAFLGTAAGTMLHSFFDFQMHVFQNALVFSLLAAIAAGPVCGRRQEEVLKQEKKKFNPVAMIALAVAACAGLFLSLQTFSSSFIRAAADRLADDRKMGKAEEYYQRAIGIDPSNWLAFRGLGNVYHNQRYYSLDLAEKKGIAPAEREMFEKGYRHNPLDAELVVGFGKATIFLGDVDAGLELLEQATKLRPFNDLYWWTLGVAQRKAGRYAQALETFQYAQTLSNSLSTRKNIQWLEKQLNPQPTQAPDAVQESPLPAGGEKKMSLSELHSLMENF
jgi:O-antigen ligase